MTKSPHSLTDKPQTLPLLPTRELIVFPKMVAPLFVGREKSVKAVEEAFARDSAIILSSQRQPAVEDPSQDDILRVGTMASIVQLFKLPDGTVKLLVEGRGRVRIDGFRATAPHFLVDVTPLPSVDAGQRRSRTLARRVAGEFAAYVQANAQLPDEVQYVVGAATNPDEVADLVAAHMLLSYEDKQRLLETRSTVERLEALLAQLIEENAVLELEHELARKVQLRVEGVQRRLFLQEQLHVIREELGEHAGEDDEVIAEYRAKLGERALSEGAQALVERELRKLRQAAPMSPEVAVIRTLLDTLLDLPWGRMAPAQFDIARVARHLERTHYGLADVKDRVLEYLAVNRLLGSDQPSTILCLVGPPGTGKSSVAQAVAAALGRPFVRVALGGVRDEAEIRGHRRTYVGAMPGRIIESLAKAGVDNPVMLLDEVDKLENDWHGNPAAALMEVLDPEQNAAFRDNYLETTYDLSQVLFIATANHADDIPDTLYDRLEVIRLAGYTLSEKVAIARRHLLPRTAAASGLDRRQVEVPAATLRGIVTAYTREAGVREMERCLRRIFRKIARGSLEGSLTLPVRVAPADLRTYLGEPPWVESPLRGRSQVGQSLALAYTADGGDVLTVETTIVKGRGELVLTGQLGEIMQESAAAAWGYLLGNVERDEHLAPLLARCSFVGEDGLSLANHDVRVHVPEGAVPKDGPSAGLALAVAMLSALAGRPVRPAVALTGEITLSGRVLRVGGLKEKCLAAVRRGVRTVVLPEENRSGVGELPAELASRLRFVFVGHFSEVLEHAFARRGGNRG